MSYLETVQSLWEVNRERTQVLIDSLRELDNPQDALGWRPGPERTHIAWQLLHIGITEELFGTERLGDTDAGFPDLVARFRGGSTPDDDIPSLELIEEVLATGREHLVAALAKYSDADLEIVPEAFAERGWTLQRALQIVTWHEAHHQGQAHLTLNLYRNRT